jgi:hypothetical protein
MRILYIAVHENNCGWGAEYFVNDGFNEIGVETSCVDYRKYRKEIVERILQTPTFDYLFLQRGDYFPIELLRAVRRPKFFWASELVSRNRDQDRLFSCGLFDHVFVRTNECKNALVEKGWLCPDRISILLSGFDSKIHYPLSLKKRYRRVVYWKYAKTQKGMDRRNQEELLVTHCRWDLWRRNGEIDQSCKNRLEYPL